MDEKIKPIYRELEDRYVKIAWTHKIHEIQATLHWKSGEQLKTANSILMASTATTSLWTILEQQLALLDPKWSILPSLLTAICALFSTYLMLRYRDGAFEEKEKSNKQHAAKCHNLRNEYEALLCEIKLGNLIDSNTVIQRRNELSEKENLLYSGTDIPHATSKAVEMATVALKQKKESKTEDDEIRAIVPEYLQEI